MGLWLGNFMKDLHVFSCFPICVKNVCHLHGISHQQAGKNSKFGYITIGFVMDVSSHDHEELGGRRIRQRVKE